MRSSSESRRRSRSAVQRRGAVLEIPDPALGIGERRGELLDPAGGTRVLVLEASDLGLSLVQEIVLLGTASLERFGVAAHLCQLAEQALDVGRDDREGLVAAEKALEVWISIHASGIAERANGHAWDIGTAAPLLDGSWPARDGRVDLEDFVRSAHAVTGHG